MKKLFLVLSMILITGCTSLEKNNDTDFEREKLKDLYIIYKINDSSSIYSSLKQIKYKNEVGKEFDLKETLENGTITIDDIISKMNLINVANDGGSLFYESTDNLTNTKFYLAKCNSSKGNGGIKDIFIFDNEDQMYNDYCTIK